jgi:hypothetical protein
MSDGVLFQCRLQCMRDHFTDGLLASQKANVWRREVSMLIIPAFILYAQLMSFAQNLLGLLCDWRGRPWSRVGEAMSLQRHQQVGAPGVSPTMDWWEAGWRQHCARFLPTMQHRVSYRVSEIRYACCLIFFIGSNFLFLLEGTVLYVLDLADRIIYKVCPIVAGGIFLGSVYWTAVTYGAVTVMQVACITFLLLLSGLLSLMFCRFLVTKKVWM